MGELVCLSGRWIESSKIILPLFRFTRQTIVTAGMFVSFPAFSRNMSYTFTHFHHQLPPGCWYNWRLFCCTTPRGIRRFEWCYQAFHHQNPAPKVPIPCVKQLLVKLRPIPCTVKSIEQEKPKHGTPTGCVEVRSTVTLWSEMQNDVLADFCAGPELAQTLESKKLQVEITHLEFSVLQILRDLNFRHKLTLIDCHLLRPRPKISSKLQTEHCTWSILSTGTSHHQEPSRLFGPSFSPLTKKYCLSCSLTRSGCSWLCWCCRSFGGHLGWDFVQNPKSYRKVEFLNSIFGDFGHLEIWILEIWTESRECATRQK